MSTILTIDQVTNNLSEGLPDDQREANHEWVIKVYNQLNDNGVLGIPNTGQIFQKKRWGFVEIVPVEQ